jgi:hypothetical protein
VLHTFWQFPRAKTGAIGAINAGKSRKQSRKAGAVFWDIAVVFES